MAASGKSGDDTEDGKKDPKKKKNKSGKDLNKKHTVEGLPQRASEK